MLTVSVSIQIRKEFIDAKMQEGKILGRNVSIKIDDEFMKAVDKDKKYTQSFPINSEKPKIYKRS